MDRLVKPLISLSAGLALGIGLLAPLAVHPKEKASVTAAGPWAVFLDSIGLQRMDDCTPHLESSTAPCEQQSLCTARSGPPGVAAVSGQKAYVGCPASFWASISDARDGPLPRPNRVSQVVGGCKLSILFCSFQN